MTITHGLRWMLAAALAVLLGGIILSACSKGGDDGPPVDMRVVLQRDDACDHITEYRIIASKPYDQTFSGVFDGEKAELEWIYMPPEAEFGLEVQLMAGATTYTFSPTIAKPWGDTAVFTISCDKDIPKPVLTLDLVAFNGVVTIPKTCRWFSEVRVLEEYAVNPDTKLPMLRRLHTGAFEADRTQFYWQAPEFNDPTVVLDLHVPGKGADGGDLVHRFRFRTHLDWGNRFDFNVLCGSTVRDVSMTLTAGGETYDPTPFGSDGDEDGDAEEDTDGDVVPDGDDIVPDGDQDTDDVDGDTTDGDAPDGDVDGDQEEETEVEDPTCGTEAPDVYLDFEAEDLFLEQESSPAGLARIVDTSGEGGEDGDLEDEDEADEEPPYVNPNVSGGAYVRLDATEPGGELVFNVTVEKSWHYRFHLVFLSGRETWGEVSLFLDNSSTPIPLLNGTTVKDLLNPSTGSYNEWPLALTTYQPLCLRAGTHRLKVRVVSTKGLGYTIGVDRIVLSSE